MEKTFQETNEKNPRELLKEVLKRANKKEKQEHEQVSNRQVAIVKRIIALFKEYTELSERNERNKCPENTSKQDSKRVREMSNEEYSKWIEKSNQYYDEYFAWSCKSLSIMTEQVGIVSEIMDLIFELCALENKEKCLLLSIVLRSQPSLMRYIESGNTK